MSRLPEVGFVAVSPVHCVAVSVNAARRAMMAWTVLQESLLASETEIMTEFYVRPDGMPPGNGYSHAVAFTGRAVIISGQLPLDRDGRLTGMGPEAQMRQVFQNLSVALAAAGADMAQVVKFTVYLTDLADVPAFRQVRDEYVCAEHPPASSLVQVAGLVHPGACVEIEALAVTLPAWPSAGGAAKAQD